VISQERDFRYCNIFDTVGRKLAVVDSNGNVRRLLYLEISDQLHAVASLTAVKGLLLHTGLVCLDERVGE
jgi:hypothetical protein